jgi:hypothetical protein
MFLMSFDRSEVYSHKKRVSFAFKISISCQIFQFFRLGIVCSGCKIARK